MLIVSLVLNQWKGDDQFGLANCGDMVVLSSKLSLLATSVVMVLYMYKCPISYHGAYNL